MITKSKFILIISIAIAALSLTFLYLNSLKYSISELTADNYYEILKLDNETSLTEQFNGIGSIFENSILFSNPKSIKYIPNFEITVNEHQPPITNIIEINDLKNKYLYEMYYRGNILNGIMLTSSHYLSDESNEIYNSEEMVNKLIKEFGYIYRETKMKSGNDIIIMENSKNFTVGTITKNGFNKISILTFHIYKRYKFFH